MKKALLSKLTFVCYKWGDMYGPEYVNILHDSVARNISVPFDFHCITDDASGLDAAIKVANFPKEAQVGNGPKLFTFSKGFLGLNDDDYIVSVDLDLVIVGSLDFLLEQPEIDFIIAPHRRRVNAPRGHGAVYRLRAGSHPRVWEDYISDPVGNSQIYSHPGDAGKLSEQSWLEHQFPESQMQFFPVGKVIKFRGDCASRSVTRFLGKKAAGLGLTLARFGTARLPGRDEAVVSFSGKVNPPDVRDGPSGHYRQAPFVKTHWRLGRNKQ